VQKIKPRYSDGGAATFFLFTSHVAIKGDINFLEQLLPPENKNKKNSRFFLAKMQAAVESREE